jgi:hypothetical protein
VETSDGKRYAAKHPDNPQGRRVLANEWICGKLARALRLPVQAVSVLRYDGTGEAWANGRAPGGTKPRRPARVLGVEWWGNPDRGDTFDRAPEKLDEAARKALRSALPFDKWVGNTDTRQALFRRAGAGRFNVRLIDHGLAFNGEKWSWPDKALHGVEWYHHAYDGVVSMDAFREQINAINKLSPRRIRAIVMSTPREWVHDDPKQAKRLLSKLASDLIARRPKVEELVLDTVYNREVCPTWPRDLVPAWLKRVGR